MTQKDEQFQVIEVCLKTILEHSGKIQSIYTGINVSPIIQSVNGINDNCKVLLEYIQSLEEKPKESEKPKDKLTLQK